MRALVEAVDVLLAEEDAAMVDADAFEHAVAVEETVVEDGDLRLGFRVELAVDKDLRFVAHGGSLGADAASR